MELEDVDRLFAKNDQAVDQLYSEKDNVVQNIEGKHG